MTFPFYFGEGVDALSQNKYCVVSFMTDVSEAVDCFLILTYVWHWKRIHLFPG